MRDQNVPSRCTRSRGPAAFEPGTFRVGITPATPKSSQKRGLNQAPPALAPAVPRKAGCAYGPCVGDRAVAPTTRRGTRRHLGVDQSPGRTGASPSQEPHYRIDRTWTRKKYPLRRGGIAVSGPGTRLVVPVGHHSGVVPRLFRTHLRTHLRESWIRSEVTIIQMKQSRSVKSAVKPRNAAVPAGYCVGEAV
jgi:hypothetical protein